MLHAHVFPNTDLSEFPSGIWSNPFTGAFVLTGAFGTDSVSNHVMLARKLGATPAEAALAGAVMSGETLSEYAERHKLSRHTVRNQMRALLHKTDSKNQTDFVRRMYLFSSPFAGQTKTLLLRSRNLHFCAFKLQTFFKFGKI